MTSREVVKAAVEFRRPERLPIEGFGKVSDFLWIDYGQPKPPPYDTDPSYDQWLCRWDPSKVALLGQVKGHPLEDLSRMKDFPWPDPNNPARFTPVKARLAEAAADPVKRDKYMHFGIFMLLWERMQALHGFENCMIDLMEDSPAIHELADRLVQYDVEFIRSMHNAGGGRIDAAHGTDDWGTQLDLQISPELWRRFFLPRYKKIFRAAHDCGMHMWLHSCGKINKALPMLIEAGLDVVEMCQPRTNGIEEIGRQFAGRICMQSICDIQNTLPSRDRRAIEEESRLLMRTWGTPRGGFVLDDYMDYPSINVDGEIMQYMLECFRRQDPWKNGWR